MQIKRSALFHGRYFSQPRSRLCCISCKKGVPTRQVVLKLILTYYHDASHDALSIFDLSFRVTETIPRNRLGTQGH